MSQTDASSIAKSKNEREKRFKAENDENQGDLTDSASTDPLQQHTHVSPGASAIPTSPIQYLKERVTKEDDCRISYAIVENEYGVVDRKILYKDTSRDQHKNEFFHGFYAYDMSVAIVRKLIKDDEQNRKEIEREYYILKELKKHENFIRCFGFEFDNDYVYIATEMCVGSVADLLEPNTPGRKQIANKDEILKSMKAKEILRQATNGLDYLHRNNCIHRNVKPNNFLIKEIGTTKQSYAIKITDFRLTRKWDPSKQENLTGSAASEGWEAPESRNKDAKLDKSLDVFILGCFYNYVLTGMEGGQPKHPFGNSDTERVDKIKKDNKVIANLFKPNEDVGKLIEQMITKDQGTRWTLKDVLKHSYFEPSENYHIYSNNKPGLCVIINQQHFVNPKDNRPGSEKDKKKLKDTFDKLGFEIKEYQDIISIDLKVQFVKLAQEDYTDYGCLVVCLLSHGIENAIMGWDGNYVNINKLKYEFALNKCPTLYGKPKIFIVQACQGYLKQDATGIVSPFRSFKFRGVKPVSIVQIPELHTKSNYEIDTINRYKTNNPPIMDFLTIKSTIPGFLSYRDPSTGSAFIQKLCELLEKEYCSDKPDPRPLQTILMDLQKLVTEEIQLLFKQYQFPEGHQTVMWEVYVNKFIVFRKKQQ